jgi:glyoxylase-like metal-dependent hydrolase (beta-lactamase superfamily II)
MNAIRRNTGLGYVAGTRVSDRRWLSNRSKKELVRMETVIPDLYASAPEALSFARTTHVRAFLLRRSQGNLLIYSAPTVADDAPGIEQLGGISRHYLNHWHEAAFGGADGIAATFGAPLFCHEKDREPATEKTDVAGTFSARHMAGDDFEAIPIPGHTPGATAYLWDSGRHRCLFTGDSLYLRQGEWVAAVLESSDRDAYIGSLELIKGLDFDTLVPWAATAGQPFHAVTDKADTARRIDAVLERVRRGDDH